MRPADRIVVPDALQAFHVKFYGAAGREWSARLPTLAVEFLDRWELRLDGPGRHGMVALALPVLMADDTPAILKLQPIDDEHPGEGSALRRWGGDGAVRLLAEDAQTGTLLLERLDGDRDLLTVPDDLEAVRIIAELLARLNAHRAPSEIRRLSEVAARMVADVPDAATALAGDQARALERWACVVADVVPEAGDQLLHWDLHYENVLAGQRELWLAIDPKPLAGDPGFELLPALHNRWDQVVASGDPPRAVRRRFDLMVEVLGLDRERAVAWTLGRVLQNALWDVEDGRALSEDQLLIASVLSDRRA